MEGTIRTLHENNLNNPSNKSNAPVYPVTMAAAVQTSDGSTIEAQVSSLEDRMEVAEERLDIDNIGRSITLTRDNISKYKTAGGTIDLSNYKVVKEVIIGEPITSPYTLILPPSIEVFTDLVNYYGTITIEGTDYSNLVKFIKYEIRQTDIEDILSKSTPTGKYIEIGGRLWRSLTLTTEQLLKLYKYYLTVYNIEESGEYKRRTITEVPLDLNNADPIYLKSDLYLELLLNNTVDYGRYIYSDGVYDEFKYKFRINILNSPSPMSDDFFIGGDRYTLESGLSKDQMLEVPSGATAVNVRYPSIFSGNGYVFVWRYIKEPFKFKLYKNGYALDSIKVYFQGKSSVERAYFLGYEKEAEVDDYVFADGSFDSEDDGIVRTAIGRCFYVDENIRLMFFKQTVMNAQKSLLPKRFSDKYSPCIIWSYKLPPNLDTWAYDPSLFGVKKYGQIPTGLDPSDFPIETNTIAQYKNINQDIFLYINEEDFDFICATKQLEETSIITRGEFNNIVILSFVKKMSQTDPLYTLPDDNDTFEANMAALNSRDEEQGPVGYYNYYSAYAYCPIFVHAYVFDGLHGDIFSYREAIPFNVKLKEWETLNSKFSKFNWYVPSVGEIAAIYSLPYCGTYFKYSTTISSDLNSHKLNYLSPVFCAILNGKIEDATGSSNDSSIVVCRF